MRISNFKIEVSSHIFLQPGSHYCFMIFALSVWILNAIKEKRRNFIGRILFVSLDTSYQFWTLYWLLTLIFQMSET